MATRGGPDVVAEVEQRDAGVIRTKLTPPRLPRGSVSRPHLLSRLREGYDRRLTLVSAPAGFGKTTLLTEWVGSDPTPFAWVTLDPSDAEPVRLWNHIIAAVSRWEPEVGRRSLDILHANPDKVTDAMLPVLFDELATGTANLVVVLDDYHCAESGDVNQQIEAFLRYRPARVQLVIATRSDPALGIARLRAGGELVEIRAESMRFDQTELADFFDGMGVTGLTSSDRARMAERTGGWPAPLRLAGLLIPDHDRESFIDSFTGGHRQVVDYLTEDVLDLLEPKTRDFLLQVSILRRLNGALCDAVVEMSGSGAVLADLERSNVFVSADADGEWYQAHQLFAEALRLELTRTRPTLVPVLHSRAAAWFESVGDRETATDHAIAAQDVTTASRLVAAQVQPLASTGRRSTIRRWLAALSWPEAERDPELALVRAIVASLDNNVDEAVAYLEVARTGAPERLDAAGLSLGFRADFMEGVVGVADVGRAEAAALRAVISAPNVGWQGIALSGVGQAMYLQGRTAEAVETLRRAVGQIPDANPIMLAFGVGNLGLAESALSVSSRADRMLDRMIDVLRSIGADRTPAAAIVLLACGERERRGGDFRAAASRFEQAIEILVVMPRTAWLANAYLLMTSVLRSLGDPAAAFRAVDQVDATLARLADSGNLRQRSSEMRELMVAPARRATEFGEQLSDREVAVLRLAASGLRQQQIADQLFISYNTVKSHLKAVYRKLGVSSRDEAVARLAELEPHPEGSDPAQHTPG